MHCGCCMRVMHIFYSLVRSAPACRPYCDRIFRKQGDVAVSAVPAGQQRKATLTHTRRIPPARCTFNMLAIHNMPNRVMVTKVRPASVLQGKCMRQVMFRGWLSICTAFSPKARLT